MSVFPDMIIDPSSGVFDLFVLIEKIRQGNAHSCANSLELTESCIAEVIGYWLASVSTFMTNDSGLT